MKRAQLLIMITGVFLLFGGFSHATCRPDAGTAIYSGNVGNSAVRVALAPNTADVQGRYAYRISAIDIVLRGKIDPSGRNLELTEFDSTGRPSATFVGAFLESDAGFANGSKLNCEVIVGMWKSGERLLDFRLMMDTLSRHGLDHLYRGAGAEDDETVNRSAAAFRTAVIKNQRDTVARMINYPITTSVAGKRTKIPSAAMLLANYDAIFTSTYRVKIEGDVPRLMFARDQGIMLGDGEVWFDPKGRVIALNN
jgi:hypothetical protein